MSLVKVDAEFEALIPALAPEEYAQLEANIKREGCRDPLRQWGDLLLDGHNRFRICKQWDIPFGTTPIELPDREAALLWIEENQIGRRNLTDLQRAVVVKSIERRKAERPEAKAAKTEAARAAKKAGNSVVPKSGTTENTNTALAKKHKVKKKDLELVASVEEAAKKAPADSPLKDLTAKMRSGEVDATEARRELAKSKPAPKERGHFPQQPIATIIAQPEDEKAYLALLYALRTVARANPSIIVKFLVDLSSPGSKITDLMSAFDGAEKTIYSVREGLENA